MRRKYFVLKPKKRRSLEEGFELIPLDKYFEELNRTGRHKTIVKFISLIRQRHHIKEQGRPKKFKYNGGKTENTHRKKASLDQKERVS